MLFQMQLVPLRRVIDALVDHFLRFRQETRALPVVWHQSLLCFVQRYKNEIRAEDKTALRKLADAQHHYQIGPEVKRELSQGRSRGEKDESEAGAGGEGAEAGGAGGVGGKKGAKGGGLFSAAVRAKAVIENPREMPAVAMLDDDMY